MKKKVFCFIGILCILISSLSIFVSAATSHIFDFQSDLKGVYKYNQTPAAFLTPAKWYQYGPYSSYMSINNNYGKGVFFTDSFPNETHNSRSGYGFDFTSNGVSTSIYRFQQGLSYSFQIKMVWFRLGGEATARQFYDMISDFKIGFLANVPLTNTSGVSELVYGSFVLDNVDYVTSLNGENIIMTFNCEFDCYYKSFDVQQIFVTFKYVNQSGLSYVQNVSIYNFNVSSEVLPEYEVTDKGEIQAKQDYFEQLFQYEQQLLDRVRQSMFDYKEYFSVEYFRELYNEQNVFKRLINGFMSVRYVSPLVMFSITLGLFGLLLGLISVVRRDRK